MIDVGDCHPSYTYLQVWVDQCNCEAGHRPHNGAPNGEILININSSFEVERDAVLFVLLINQKC